MISITPIDAVIDEVGAGLELEAVIKNIIGAPDFRAAHQPLERGDEIAVLASL